MNHDQEPSTEFALAAEAVATRQNVQIVTLLTALLRQKASMLLWGLGGAALAGALSFAVPPYYTAQTLVLPPQTRASSAIGVMGQLSLGGDAGGLASLGSALQSKAQGDSFAVLLTAWPVQNEVVQDLHLRDVYHSPTLEAARKALTGNTSTTNAKGFVTLAVTDSDPQRAAAIANDYIHAVRDSMRDMALTDASQRRIFYQGQLARAKDDLAQAEVNLTQVQQNSKMVSIDSQARVLLERAATLRSQITAQEVELQRLRSYLTEDNSQLQIAETSLNALRGQLAQVESQSSGGGFTGGGLTGVPGAALDFVRATREVKYREALYDLMAKQYEASHIDESRTAPVVQVIEPAFAPERKTGPHRSIFLLGGFLLAFILRLSIVLYRYWRSNLDEDDLRRLAEMRRATFALR